MQHRPASAKAAAVVVAGRSMQLKNNKTYVTKHQKQ
jgi:hypothetical protein